MRMGKARLKSKPTWADVKAKLTTFDRPGLLALLQSLYAADERNRAFLHARFGLGEEPLQPYKKIIDRCLWPDVFRGQPTSVSRAKQAITGYKNAIGDSEGIAELMVFYCERAAGFSRDVSHQDTAPRCARAHVPASPESHNQSDSQHPERISYPARPCAEYRS